MTVIVFNQDAERELRNAHAWYNQQRQGLGDEFLKAIDDSLESIRLHPFSFPLADEVARYAALKRFPYLIVFHATSTRILVLSVFHTRRKPRTGWSHGL
ncbi:MAG: type II toxin-antitoxin system RelE/ParE family toxin [Actinomycetaceae bacterium]|nr:type II toxin-antitoxin system RelE/ParE family toxin [Actinomycetaceae bacterium]